MEIKEYVDQKKRLYDLFITFVEQENENDEDDRLLFDYQYRYLCLTNRYFAFKRQNQKIDI